jgi:hypothetical protein
MHIDLLVHSDSWRYPVLKKLALSQLTFEIRKWIQMSRVAVSNNVWLRAGRPGDRVSISGRGERIFPLASVSRPALGPTQPPVQWVPGVLSLGLKRGLGVTLTTHPHLVLRLRMSRSYISSPLKRLHGM